MPFTPPSRPRKDEPPARSLEDILSDVLSGGKVAPSPKAPQPTPQPEQPAAPAKTPRAFVQPSMHRAAVKLLDDLTMRHAMASGVTEQLAAQGTLNVELMRALDAYNAAGGWEACPPTAPEALAVPLWLRRADKQAQVELAAWYIARDLPSPSDLDDPGEPQSDADRARERNVSYPRPNPPSRDEQVVEYLKCRRSVVYFIDNFCSIEHKVRGVIPFRLWRWQAWLLFRWQQNPLNIALKARQIGVSELAAAYSLWLARFYDTKVCLFISKGETDAMVLLGRAKIMVTYLPAWLYPGNKACIDPCVIVRENTQIFELAHIDKRGKPHRSLIESLAATQGAGRSRTAAVVVLDEWAHMLWAEQIWSAVEATADGGGTIIGISTANGLGNLFADTWEATQRVIATQGREKAKKEAEQARKEAEAAAQEAQEAPQAAPEAVEAPNEPAETLEEPEEGENDENGEKSIADTITEGFYSAFLSWRRHPERNQRWYDTKLRLAKGKGDRHVAILHQEFPSEPMEAFIQSGRPVFSKDVLLEHVKRLHEEEAARVLQGLPAWDTSEDGLIIYEEPIPGHRYIIGADVAEGLPHGDFDDACVFDRETGHEVATLHGRWPIEAYASKLDKLGRHYNDALLAVERNNHGHAALLALTSGLAHERWAGKREPYRNLYHQKNDLVPGRREDSRPGWETNVRTKPLAIDTLDRMLRENAVTVRCELFLSVEALIFSYREDNTQTSAPAGKNDDSVLSHAIAVYLLAQPDHGALALQYMERLKAIVEGRVQAAAALQRSPSTPTPGTSTSRTVATLPPPATPADPATPAPAQE